MVHAYGNHLPLHPARLPHQKCLRVGRGQAITSLLTLGRKEGVEVHLGRLTVHQVGHAVLLFRRMFLIQKNRKTYPGRLVLENQRGFLVAEAQLQPHSVRLHQSVQDTEPAMERVVA